MSRQTATIAPVNPAAEPATAFPRFDVAVVRDGYRWWYVDGLSDCGRHGVVVIAFVGSVFSPYYYRARAQGRGEPENFCAVNVAIYSPGARRWAMTERDRGALDRRRGDFALGPSHLSWRDDSLRIAIDERSTPFARRVAGEITIHPHFLNAREFKLDQKGRHRWQPLAPSAAIEVAFRRPSIAWKGHGYLDTNAGTRPLEDDFATWNWSRRHAGGTTRIHYNVTERGADERPFCVRFDRGGGIDHPAAPRAASLPKGLWGVARPLRCDAPVRLVNRFEDAPFYTRSMFAIDSGGHESLAVHESLSMTRFVKPWVRALLPFRMPRRGSGRR